MWSTLVNAARVEYNAIRIWSTTTKTPEQIVNPPPNSAYDTHLKNSSTKHTALARHRDHNLRISTRTISNDDSITLQGWPSRGGIIVLEHATPPDFDFLQLDPLDPPLRRDPNQKAEDIFCQALLHLGAKWLDSETRLLFVQKLEYANEDAHEAVDANENLAPTRRERGWVRVAWPSDPPGALCVLDCDKTFMGRDPEAKLKPK